MKKCNRSIINMMRGLLMGLIISGVLIGCSSDGTPSHELLMQHVQMIPASARTLHVVSRVDFRLPVGDQQIEERGIFKTTEDIYDSVEDKVILPKGATLSGLYTNNGVSCTIKWDSVYANNDKTANEINAVDVSKIALPTVCNPHRMIKAGDNLLINITNRTQ